MGTPPITAARGDASTRHIPALDGLRGLAIILVLAWHLLPPDVLAGSAWLAPLALIRNVGWAGVDLFFVLSGFLITSILVRNRNSPRYFRSFYARRALRIVPLYYLLLTLCVFVIPTIPYLERYGYFYGDQGTSTWHWLFLANLRYILPIPEHQFLGVTWSLSIEEQYYVVWPLIVWLFRGRWLMAVDIGLILTSVGLRYYLVDYTDMSNKFPYLFTLSHVDGLAVGGLIALAYQDRARYGRMLNGFARALPLWAALVVGVAYCSVNFSNERFSTYEPTMLKYGYFLNALLFGALLLHCVMRAGVLSRLFGLAPLRSVGKYSYAMYLFHWPAYFLVSELLALTGPLEAGRGPEFSRFLLYCVATYAIGWLSWRIFEGPINEQKRHFRF